MNRQSRFILPALVVALSAAAQSNDSQVKRSHHEDQVCTMSSLSTVEHRDGVTVETATFTEVKPGHDDRSPLGEDGKPKKKDPVNVHLYLPDGDGPFHMLLFSFSSIHSNEGTTDLFPFTFAMSRAGVAVLVLDRIAEMRNYDDAEAHSTSVIECASLWFKDHISGGAKSVGTGGTYYIPQWTYSIKTDHLPGQIIRPPMQGKWGGMGFGTTGPAEWKNTEMLQTVEGQQKLANWYGRQLELKPIPREWLHVETKPDGAQIASK